MIAPRSDELVRLIEPGHVYLIGEGLEEREAPSLSRVLEGAGLAKDYSGIDPGVLSFAARRGTAVHEMIECFLSTGVTASDAIDGMDPFLWIHVEPYFRRFEDWWAGRKAITATIYETPAYNPDLKYACTADFLGEIDGDLWTLDWKTTSRISKTVALQTAGQAHCFDWGADHVRRGALWLRKDAPAKIVEFTDDEEDYATLAAAAKCYNARGRYL